MKPQNWCEYGEHPITKGDYVIYWDDERELDGINMCKHCYALHILKYFPQTRVAYYIKNNPTEYSLTLEEMGVTDEA